MVALTGFAWLRVRRFLLLSGGGGDGDGCGCYPLARGDAGYLSVAAFATVALAHWVVAMTPRTRTA